MVADDTGYDRDDPKHPDFLEMWLDYADTIRKREKEDAHEAEWRAQNDPPPPPDPED